MIAVPTIRPEAPALRAPGFTLIEILVVIAIMGMVLGMVYGSFVATNQGRRIYDRVEGRYHLARVAMRRMTLDISMAFLSKHQSADENTKTLFKGDEDRLDFTYLGHRRFIKGRRESDRGEVGYSLASHPNDSSVKCLFRRESAHIDDKPDEGGKKRRFICGIKELKFQYWSDDQEDWQSEWDSEATDQLGKLPNRVKITLVLSGDDEQEYRFETQAAIGVTEAIQF